MKRLVHELPIGRVTFIRQAVRTASVLVIALLCALTLCLAPPAADRRVVQAQDTPPEFLGSITAGPDGNMWFIEAVEQRIGRITPNGHVTSFPLPKREGGPGDLTNGPDGALWFTTKHAVGRMSVHGQMTFLPLPSTMQPGAIVSGPDGALWFSAATPGPAIVRLSTNGHIRIFPSLPAGSLAFGGDGALWFTNPNGQDIGRLTRAGQSTAFALPARIGRDAAGLGSPISITRGPDGALWFTEFDRFIGRIDRQGHITEFPLPNLKCCIPFFITTGPDHALWVTELYGNGVERITLRGHVRQFEFHTRSAGPLGIAAGPDGNLWVTATCSNRIVRVTPTGQEVEFAVSTRHGTSDYCFGFV